MNGAVAADSPSHVVVDGPAKLITGQAAGSAFDFGLALVEYLAGRERAEEVRASICY